MCWEGNHFHELLFPQKLQKLFNQVQRRSPPVCLPGGVPPHGETIVCRSASHPPLGFPEVWIMPLLIRGGEEESACPGHPGKGVQLSPSPPKTSISVKGDLSSTFQTSMYL